MGEPVWNRDLYNSECGSLDMISEYARPLNS